MIVRLFILPISRRPATINIVRQYLQPPPRGGERHSADDSIPGGPEAMLEAVSRAPDFLFEAPPRSRSTHRRRVELQCLTAWCSCGQPRKREGAPLRLGPSSGSRLRAAIRRKRRDGERH